MMRVMGGWIVEEIGHCTCNASAEPWYGHERMCGYEPVEQLEPLKAIVRTYPNVWEGYSHCWKWIIPNPCGGEQDAFDFGWETTFKEAIAKALERLRLLGEQFAAYAEMAS